MDITKQKEATQSPLPTQWISRNGIDFKAITKTIPVLPPAYYEVEKDNGDGSYTFKMLPASTESIVRLPDAHADEILKEIQAFWGKRAFYEDIGLTYKKGILMHGPQGSGKTTALKMVAEDVIARDGIVIQFTTPHHVIEGMKILRQVQPKTPVVMLMEDLDDIIEYYDETDILNLLDGVEDVSNVVFLATTNFPENLSDRLRDRPGRFDKRFEIGYPSVKCRRAYFENLISRSDLIDLTNFDIDAWVRDTEDFSIAHMRALFTDVMIQGESYKKRVRSLRNMMEEKISSKDYKKNKVGF